MSASLTLESVSILIRGRQLIRDLHVTISAGEIVTLMGPSGSGKSTLVAFIGGHLDPSFEAIGKILVEGEDVTALAPERRRIGILFQDDVLFPHLSVGGNLAFGLTHSKKGRAARQDEVVQALVEAGLDDFADRDPATLSGGQRARAALLRTLLSEPQALLLDEPFGNLDDALRGEFRRFVFEHAIARGLPVLLVTHDSADAAAAGGPVLMLG